jgi:fucose permease
VGRLPWGYWVWFLVICLCGSVEVSLNLWAADLLRDRAGLSPGDATAAVGAVVAGMFTGRIIGARLALRLPAVPLFLGAIAVSAVGFFVLWFAVTAPVGVLGLVLCGLGIALHFPLAITQALRASEGQTDLASARSLYAMAVAFGLAPALLGLAADATSVRVAFLIVPVLLTAAATLAWRSRSRPGSPSPASSPSADPDPRATAVPQPPS